MKKLTLFIVQMFLVFVALSQTLSIDNPGDATFVNAAGSTAVTVDGSASGLNTNNCVVTISDGTNSIVTGLLAISGDSWSTVVDFTTATPSPFTSGASLTIDAVADDAGTTTATTVNVTYDIMTPTILSINREAAQANPTNGASAVFTVTFDEPVSGIDVNDFDLVDVGGTITGESITSVSASSGTVIDVTVNTGSSGDGDLRLDFDGDDGTGLGVTDAAGNTTTSSEDAVGDQTVTIDKSAPTILSINREAAQANPTNGASAVFTVTFDEPASGIDVNDFDLVDVGGTITGESITSVSASSGTVIDVTVNTGSSGDGDLRLDFDGDDGTGLGVSDALGNTTTASEDAVGDQTVTIDKSAPTILSINREAAQADPTNGASAVFTVTFDGSVTGVDVNDFDLVDVGGTITGESITSVSASSGTVIDVTVNTGSSGDGDLRLDFDGDDGTGLGVTDAAGNTTTSSEDAVGDQTVTVDKTIPTVLSINREAAQADPTNGASAVFTVTFDGSVTGVDVNDFDLVDVGGTITGESITSVSASSGTVIDVTVNTGSSGDGDLRLDFDGDDGTGLGVTDAAGNTTTSSEDAVGDQTVTIDKSAPTILSINREAAQADPTNGASAVFTVTFDEPASGIDVNDFDLVDVGGTITGESITSVSASSGTVIDVTVNTGSSGDGDLRLDFDGDDGTGLGVSDALGNTTTASEDAVGDQTVTIDKSAPTILSINREAAQANPTNGASAVFTVTFDEPASGIDVNDFDLVDVGGTITGESITSVSASSGTVIDVTVNTGSSGDGDLRLDFDGDDGTGLGVSDALGNTTTASEDAVGDQTVTIDKSAPTILSINREAAQANPTNGASAVFTVTFDEPASGIDVNDFDLVDVGGTITGESITSVSASSGTVIDVTVNTGSSGDGDLRLDFDGDDGTGLGVTDAAGNTTTSSEDAVGDQTVTVDKTIPTVLSINREAAQADPTNGASAVFTVTFDGSVTGVDVNDFDLVDVGGTITGESITSVSASSGTVIDVTVNTGSSGDGDLRLDFDGDDGTGLGVTDAAGNTTTSSEDAVGDQTVTIDKSAPTILSINREAAQADPTNGASAVFTVTFDEPASGIDVNDFDLVDVGGTITGESITSVSASSGTVIDVTVNTGSSGDGDLRLDFDGDDGTGLGVSDALGNTTTASEDAVGDQTVTIDKSAPTILSINREAAQANPTNGASAVFTVTFDEPASGIDVNDFDLVDVGGTITGESITSVSASSGTVIDVTVNTGSSGDGDLRLDFDGDDGTGLGVSDALGNTTTASEDAVGDQTVTIDKSAPTILSINREAAQANPTNGASAVFTVTFDEPASGIDVNDFDLVDVGGTITGESITSVSASSGTVIDVTVNTGSSGDGDLRLDFDGDDGTGLGVSDALGNTTTASEDAVGDQTITIDKTIPTVLSINREAAQADPTNGASAVFTVTFDGSVTGVDVNDFDLVDVGGTITGESITSVSASSGTVIDVTVNTGSNGDGDLRLDFDGDDGTGLGVTDAAGNTTTSAEDAVGDQTVEIDKTAPTVSDLEIFDTDDDGYIDRIDIIFSEPVVTADGLAPQIGDLGGTNGGGLAVPDGSTVTTSAGLSIDDPNPGGLMTISVTGIAVADHLTEIPNTAVGSTGIDGLQNLWEDLAGNPITITGDDSEGRIDSANPVLTSSTPSPNSLSASQTADFVFNFSETVQANSGFIRLREVTPPSEINTFDITTVLPAPATSFNVSHAALTLLTQYAIRIDATAIEDVSAATNPYAGILDDTGLSFTVNNIQPNECSPGFDYFTIYNEDGSSSNNGHLAESACNDEPASISSTFDTEAEAVSVFFFNILNGSDGHENMTSVTIQNGNPAVDWTEVIAGAQLIDEEGDIPRTTGGAEVTPTISATSLSWTGMSDVDGGGSWSDLEGNDDDGTEPGFEMALRIWLRADMGDAAVDIDNEPLVFTLSHNDINGVDRVSPPGAATGTADDYVENATLDISSGSVLIDVQRTHYNFGVAGAVPTDTDRNSVMSTVQIQATDINGNRDEDYNETETVTITSTGTVNPAPTVTSFSSGVATVSDIIHIAEGTNLTLGTSGGMLDNSFDSNNPALPNSGLLARDFDITGDVTPPTVVSVTPSVPTISDSDVSGTFTVSVLYNESLNTGFSPDIVFSPDVIASSNLSFVGGAFDSNVNTNDTYIATYNLTDQNALISGIDVTVGSVTNPARDLSNNDQTVFPNTTDVFNIDTQNPTVTNVVANVDPINNTHTGTGTFTLTVSYSEAMIDDGSADPTISFPVEDPSSTLTFDALSSGFTNSTTYVAIYDVADNDQTLSNIDVRVLGGQDVNGNTQVQLDDVDNFSIDNDEPSTTGVVANIDPIVDTTVGTGTFTLTVSYDEAMIDDGSADPTISFPVEDPSSTLTFDALSSGFTNSTTYVAVYDVAEADETLLDIDVRVLGGQDVSGNSQNQFDGADNFTIDTETPAVLTVVANVDPVVDATLGTGTFTLTVTYDETMIIDGSADPAVSFPVEDPLANTLTFNAVSSGWTNGTTYVAAYDVADMDETLADIDVRVTGARDANNNLQTQFDGADNFSIDMENPTVTNVVANVDPINNTHTGTGTFTLTVSYSEAMIDDGSADPTISFPVEDPSSTLTFDALSSGFTNSTTYVAIYDVADNDQTLSNIDVRVLGGQDVNGNTQVQLDDVDNFSVDNDEPSTTSVVANIDPIVDTTVGTGTFTLTVSYDEAMIDDGSADPTISFPVEDPSSTLTFDALSSGFTNSTTYVAVYDVAEADETLLDIDVRVLGGQDVSGNSQNQFDGADNFTIDTETPAVLTVVANVDPVVDATLGTGTFTLTVTYDETMIIDGSADPAVSFPVEDPLANTLTFNAVSSGWTNGTTYVAAYDVADMDETLADIDVRVTGARDANNNLQTQFDGADNFSIDMENPTVTNVVANVDPINNTHTGTGTFTLTVSYSEAMIDDGSADPTISFPVEDPSSTLTFDALSSGFTNSTTYVAIYDVADNDQTLSNIDVRVLGGQDVNGNTQVQLDDVDNFSIDNDEPSTTGVVANIDPIVDTTVGTGTFTLTVSYDEAMIDDGSADPTISFPVEDPSSTLTFDALSSGFTNSTTYVAVYDVAEADETLLDIDVRVLGGQDVSGNSQNQFDGADNFTIDTETPAVLTVVANVDPVVDATLGTGTFTLTVTYDETMIIDGSADPAVSFPVEDPLANTLTFNAVSSGWTNGTTYVAAYDVADMDETLADIDVRVTGARDANNNLQTQFDGADNFSIDMENPTVTNVVANVDPINNTHTGTGTFTLTVSYSEAMIDDGSADPTISFPVEDPSSTLTFDALSSGFTNSTTYVAVYDVADNDQTLSNIDVRVLGGQDVNGNTQVQLDDVDNFSVDNDEPSTTSVVANIDPIVDTTVGTGTFTLTVSYDEAMIDDGSADPTISFPVEDPSSTLTFDALSSGFTNSTTYVAVYDVAEADETLLDIDVRVLGGQDVSGNSQNQFDGADNFTIDTETPAVLTVVANVDPVVDATLGTGTFTLTVTYDETMIIDGSADPAVSFPMEDPLANTLTFNAVSSGWTNGTTYVAAYDVADMDETLADIDVRVTGARDANNNLQTQFDGADNFSIDMENPTVVNLNVSSNPITDVDAIAGTITITVEYDETMIIDGSQDPTISFPVEDPSSTLTFDALSSGFTNSTTYVAVYDVADNDQTLSDIDVRVTGGQDVVGNTQNVFDEVDDFSIDTENPAVTVAEIAITSTPTGVGGTVYIAGNTITAQWDNSAATGDGNADVTTNVTMDFTDFGGSATEAASNIGGDIWEASHLITPGTQDRADARVSVTATDIAGNSTTQQDDLDLSVDNEVPTITAANFSITTNGSGASGTTFIEGDLVTVVWDDTNTGDDNGDIAELIVDFTEFGGPSNVAAGNVANTWTATYTMAAGSIDLTGRNVFLTATDDADNISSTVEGDDNEIVDNEYPVITENPNVNVSGALGNGGAFIIDNVVTATWNNTGGGDNNGDIAAVNFDFVEFGGGEVAATNSSNTWTATYTIVAGSINGVADRNVFITAVDDADNETIVEDSESVLVDNQRPSAPSIPDLIAADDNGNDDTDDITGIDQPQFDGTANSDFGNPVFLYTDQPAADTRIDDGSIVSDVGTGAWSVPSNIVLSNNAIHNIEATTFDAAGNESPRGTNLVFQHISPPTYTSSEWLDTDADGNLDRLRVTFDKAVDVIDADGTGFTALTISNNNWTIDFDDTDQSQSSVGNTIELTVDPLSGMTPFAGTADPVETITYATSASSIAEQVGGIEVVVGDVDSPTDGAAPVIINSLTMDETVQDGAQTTPDGSVSRIEIELSEPVDNADLTADLAFFSLTPPLPTLTFGTADVMTSFDQEVTEIAVVDAPDDQYFAMEFTPTNSSGTGIFDLEYLAGGTAVVDANGNRLSIPGGTELGDGAAPRVVNFSDTDPGPDNNSNLTPEDDEINVAPDNEISIQFSEDVTWNTTQSVNFLQQTPVLLTIYDNTQNTGLIDEGPNDNTDDGTVTITIPYTTNVSTNYNVTISPGAFVDAANNTSADQFSAFDSWNFQTETALVVVGTSANLSAITITLNDDPTITSPTISEFVVRDGLGTMFSVDAINDLTGNDFELEVDLSMAVGDLEIDYNPVSTVISAGVGTLMAFADESVDFDSGNPALSLATRENGTEIRLSTVGNEPIQVTGAAVSDFVIQDKRGDGTPTVYTVTGIDDSNTYGGGLTINNYDIILTVSGDLSTAIGDIQIDYTNNGGGISDYGGNPLLTETIFIDLDAVNPSISSAVTNGTTQIDITFNDVVQIVDGDPATDFTVLDGGGNALAVTTVADNTPEDNQLELILGNFSDALGDFTLIYGNSATQISDFGNNSLVDTSVPHIPIEVDGTAPNLLSATKISDTRIDVEFDEEIQIAGSGGDFTVVDETGQDFTSGIVVADGTAQDNIVELTLADISTAVGDIIITYDASDNEVFDFGGNNAPGGSVSIDFDLTVEPAVVEIPATLSYDTESDISYYRTTGAFDATTVSPVTITPSIDGATVRIYRDAALTDVVGTDITGVSNSTGTSPTVDFFMQEEGGITSGVFTFYIVEVAPNSTPAESPTVTHSLAFLGTVGNSAIGRSFGQLDDEGTTISVNHPVTQDLLFLGNGLTSIDDDNVGGVSQADFIPSAAGNGTSQISIRWQSLASTIAATFEPAEWSFTVSATSDVFDVSQAVAFAQDATTSALVLNPAPTDIDIAGGIDGDNSDFHTLEVYHILNGSPNDAIGTDDGVFFNLNTGGNIASSILSYTGTPAIDPLGGDPTSISGWTINPVAFQSIVPSSPNSVDTLLIVNISKGDDGSSLAIMSEGTEVYLFSEPTVELRGLDPTYCEDDGDVELSARIFTFPVADGGFDEVVEIRNGYTLERYTDGTYSTVAASVVIPGVTSPAINVFDPIDPMGDGSTAAGFYRITYTSEPQTPAGVVSTDQFDIQLVATGNGPSIDLTADLTSAGGFSSSSSSYVFEFCETDPIPTISIDTGDANSQADESNTLYNWYEGLAAFNNGDVAFDSVASVSGAELIGSAPSRDIYVTRILNGCESLPTLVTIRVFDDPTEPTIDTSPASVAVDRGEYFFEYCATPSETVVPDAIALTSSLASSDFGSLLEARSYFRVYSDENGTNPIFDLPFDASELVMGTDPEDVYLIDFVNDLGATNVASSFANNAVVNEYWISTIIADGSLDADDGTVIIGCESPLTKVTFSIYTEPEIPALASFTGDPDISSLTIDVALADPNRVDYFMCEGPDQLSVDFPDMGINVPTGDDAPNPALEFEFEWYTDAALTDKITTANRRGEVLAQGDLLAHTDPDGNYSPSVGSETTHTYFVRLVSNINEDSGYPGCVGPVRQVNLTVFPDVVEPVVDVLDSENELDDTIQDPDADFDVEFNFCVDPGNGLNTDNIFRSAISYAGESGEVLRWFPTDATGTINGAAIVSQSDDFDDVNNTPRDGQISVTASDLRLQGLTNTGVDGETFAVIYNTEFDPDGFNGCFSIDTAFVRVNVSTIPDPKFRFNGLTRGRTTVFRFDDANEQDATPATDGIQLTIFDPNGVELITREASDFGDTIHYSFQEAGVHSATMTVTTSAGCFSEETRSFQILDNIPVTSSYLQTFENNTDDVWFAEFRDEASGFEGSIDAPAATRISSWGYSAGPNGTNNISTSTAGVFETNGIWSTTGNEIFTVDSDDDGINDSSPINRYAGGEVSYLYSPSFDLSGLDNPAVSFASVRDFDGVRDGVVFQYSTDDGETWQTLGDFDPTTNLSSGQFWYNANGVSSNPGNQQSNIGDGTNQRQVAWTSNYAAEDLQAISASNNGGSSFWATSSHALTIVTGEPFVRFRFAINSLGTLTDTKGGDGFAFDDFRLFSLTKTVMVEQFSSSNSQGSKEVNTDIRQLVNLNGVMLINYFTDLPNEENQIAPSDINGRNRSDPRARAAYYGINSQPSSVLDGDVFTQSQPDTVSWNSNDINIKGLVPATFDIENLAVDASTSPGVITITSRFVSNEATTNRDLSFTYAIVEDTVVTPAGGIGVYNEGDVIPNVLRLMLPGPTGFNYTGNTEDFNQSGETDLSVFDEYTVDWIVDDVYDPNNLRVIAFVQDNDTKEILQSAFVDIVGATDEVLGISELRGFSVYPNPANEVLTVEFEQTLDETSNWILYDQTGREVLKGLFEQGKRQLEVNTSEVPAGLYFINIFSDENERKVARVIIAH